MGHIGLTLNVGILFASLVTVLRIASPKFLSRRKLKTSSSWLTLEEVVTSTRKTIFDLLPLMRHFWCIDTPGGANVQTKTDL